MTPAVERRTAGAFPCRYYLFFFPPFFFPPFFFPPFFFVAFFLPILFLARAILPPGATG